MQQYNYNIINTRPLNDDVLQVIAKPLTTALSYQAGQYVNIILDNGEMRPYSIANAPNQHHHIEFHIRKAPEIPYMQALFAQLNQGNPLTLSAALGHNTYPPKEDLPILLIAGGTGFAPCKAIIEQAIDDDVDIHLYWGVHFQSQYYDLPLLDTWQNKMANFRYSLVSEVAPNNWSGKVGLLTDAIKARATHLSDYQYYIFGSYELAMTMRTILRQANVNERHMHCDMFDLTK